MTDELRDAITNAVRRLHADATDIVIPDDISQLASGGASPLTLTWKADDRLHLGNFLAWTTGVSSHEIDVLTALSATEVPIPRLITSGSSGDTQVNLADQVEGESMASMISKIGMRWEISATAFTYARMLARINGLDWTKVTPWLADAEAVPEDIIDDQVDAEMEYRSEQAATLSGERRAFVEQVIKWLDLRRPVAVSLCLCHGHFHPANIYAVGEDVTAVLDWSNARVTDASYDLAMLPVWLNDLGLSREDAELFAQAAHGAYLQTSPKGLANNGYYSVARPLDQLIERLQRAGADAPDERIDDLVGIIERAMTVAGRVPWKNR